MARVVIKYLVGPVTGPKGGQTGFVCPIYHLKEVNLNDRSKDHKY